MVKLSIVIPVYKVESYLRAGLDSVAREWREGVEVIAVNDGSPDGSLAILREYECRYDFIRVIDQKNAGVSVARNAGIENARGDWITFMDPDDAYAEGAIAWMLERISRTDADIIHYGSRVVHDQNEHVVCEPSRVVNYQMTAENDVLFVVKSIFPIAWNCCYRLEAFREVRYVPGLAKSQDSVYGFACLCRASKIESSNTIVYKYFQREDSCVHTVSEKRVRGCIDASACIFELARKWRWYDLCKKVIFRKVRVASIGEAVGLMREFPKAKQRELWAFFFDRMETAFFKEGYVPPVFWAPFRLAFCLRSPFLVKWTLYRPYQLARCLTRNELLRMLWVKIR